MRSGHQQMHVKDCAVRWPQNGCQRPLRRGTCSDNSSGVTNSCRASHDWKHHVVVVKYAHAMLRQRVTCWHFWIIASLNTSSQLNRASRLFTVSSAAFRARGYLGPSISARMNAANALHCALLCIQRNACDILSILIRVSVCFNYSAHVACDCIWCYLVFARIPCSGGERICTRGMWR